MKADIVRREESIPSEIRQYARRDYAKPAQPAHASTAAFLDEHNKLVDDRNRLEIAHQEQRIELTTRQRRIDLLEMELARSQQKAETFERGFLTLEAHISVLAMSGTTFTTACMSALSEAKSELAKIGMGQREVRPDMESLANNLNIEVAQQEAQDVTS